MINKIGQNISLTHIVLAEFGLILDDGNKSLYQYISNITMQ